mgnify:CR=1 FL=1
MSVTELQNYAFVSKYARWIPEKKRRETWKESVTRVREMMHEQYPEVNGDIDWAYDLMYKKRVLGSQRALQFGGKPIFKHHARVYNCIASYVDRPRFFQECMYLLLCGCGVGFSVQKHHVEKLPKLVQKKEGTKKFIIPDTIEGWSDAVGVLVSSYFENDKLFSEYTGRTVNFDFSEIRPAGSYLSSSSGKAPGPEPLKKALTNVKKVLDKALKEALFSTRKLRPIDVYDVVMHAADAVISGGVRRSATICLFSPDDEEMALAKTGNWFHDNPQRGRSNNSALLLRDSTTPEQFSELMQSVKEFGEPGFVWSDSTELIVNPCVEIGLYPVDEETGETGWQACNLSTINCAKVKTKEEFFESCRAASIIGTLQAGFTTLPYLGEVSERIFKREALLGVSMTGIMEQHELCLDPAVQKEGARVVKRTNKEFAAKIGINPAARTTCVKPEGTASCILGTSSGIHPHHAKRYIRRVQANKLEDIYQHFKKTNPRACEESVWSANDSDDVVSFCIEVSKLINTPILPIFFFTSVCVYEKLTKFFESIKSVRLIVIFSPIFAIIETKLSLTLFLFSISVFKISSIFPALSNDIFDISSTNFINSLFLATKSVSLFNSIIENLF